MLVPESEIGLLWRPDFLCHPNSSILRSRRRAVDSEGLKVLRRPGRDKQGEGNQRNQIRNAEMQRGVWSCFGQSSLKSGLAWTRLEDDFSLQPEGFQVPCGSLPARVKETAWLCPTPLLMRPGPGA